MQSRESLWPFRPKGLLRRSMQPGRADTGIMFGRLCVANPSPSTGEAGGARGLVFLRSELLQRMPVHGSNSRQYGFRM